MKKVNITRGLANINQSSYNQKHNTLQKLVIVTDRCTNTSQMYKDTLLS